MEALEDLDGNGVLEGCEAFVFTDNSVAESTFYKGSSANRTLFDSILRLRKLEHRLGAKVWIIHVAGTRVIDQGSDGISRGDMNKGVMKGAEMLEFVPIHKSAIERRPQLVNWVKGWASDAVLLQREEWFERAHNIISYSRDANGVLILKYRKGTFIWSPAPAVDQVAIEQLRSTRNKWKNSTHIFVIPRLFTVLWRKQLYRVSGLIINLPFDDSIWPNSHHEPLCLGFIFPFIPHKPWQLRSTPAFLGMERYPCEMWEEEGSSKRYLLTQLRCAADRLSTMSERMVWEMLHGLPRDLLSYHPSRKRRGSDLGKSGRSKNLQVR